MKAAIYARVSTLDQEPENQLQELRRYIAARGWPGTRQDARREVGATSAPDRSRTARYGRWTARTRGCATVGHPSVYPAAAAGPKTCRNCPLISAENRAALTPTRAARNELFSG